MRRIALVAAIALLGVRAEGADDRHAVIRAFFQAYANGDPLAPFWSASSPSRDGFEKAARVLHGTRCLELSGVRIEQMTGDGNAASARVTVGLTKRERATRRVHTIVANDYVCTLVREGGRWRMREVELVADRFSTGLIAAASDAARRDMLASAPDMISSELVRALMRQAHFVGNIPNLVEAARIAAIAEDVALSAEDRGGVALVLCLRSVLARVENRIEDSRRIAREALAMARSVDDTDVVVRALFNLARTYDNDPDGATRRQLLEDALLLEDRVEDLSLMTRIANAFEMAAGHREDYLALRKHIDQQIRYARLSGDTIGLASAMLNLGNVYEDLGDPRSCIEYARQSATLTQTVSPGNISIRARLLELRCLRLNGEIAAARKRIDPLLAEARQWKEATVEWHTLIELAEHYLVARAYGDAERVALEALEIGRKTGGRPRESYMALARIYLEQGRYADVLAMTRAYWNDPSETGAYAVAITKTFDAKARRGLGDRVAALADLHEAMDASEAVRSHVPGDARQRAVAFATVADAYAEAVDLNVELGRVEDALACAERAKGRVLLEALHGGAATQARSMKPEHAETERRLEAELASLNRRLARAKPDEMPALREQLERARVEYASFHASLYAADPRLRVQRGDVSVASLRTMQDALLAGAVLVEYVVGDARTHAFVVSSSGARVRTLPVTRKALEELIAEYRKQLAERDLTHRQTARRLDAILLAPLEELISDASIVGIVADGALWKLPFEALVDGRGKYRLERHTMFYAPSISVFVEMRSEGARRPRHGARTLLAVGAPVIGGPRGRQLAAVYRGTDLGPLPDAKLELEALRSIYGRGAKIYVGSMATETRVKKAIGGTHDVLHFATHGILDDSSPMYSRLLLSESREAAGADADGLLEAWELMKLDVSADLLVMSSCESASGRVSAGEGMIGMTWAAFVAGARTTVASLWKVASKSTATLMVDFHRELHRNPDRVALKAAALRAAKLRMLRDPMYRHPFHWAAFVAIGDPDFPSR